MRLSEGDRFGLVTDQYVDVGKNLVKGVLEELRDKGSGKIENKSLNIFSLLRLLKPAIDCTHLVLRGSLLSQSFNGRYTDRQVEATDVEDLSVLDLLPDALRLQVLHLVVVGSREIGAQRAVVAGNDNTAATGWGLLVIEVLGLDARFPADPLQSLAILVLADAANVDDRVGLEDVLCNDS